MDLPGAMILLRWYGTGFLDFFVDIAGGETACENDFVFILSSLALVFEATMLYLWARLVGTYVFTVTDTMALHFPH